MIIDTDVLIWHFRGNERAKDIIHKSVPFYISVITYMELIKGMRNKRELKSLMRQLAKWKVEILHVNNDISTRAMIFVEEYFLSGNMEMADALIAATCINHSESLITGNEKHYKMIPNLQIVRFSAVD